MEKIGDHKRLSNMNRDVVLGKATTPFDSIIIDREISDSIAMSYWNLNDIPMHAPRRVTYNRVFLVSHGVGNLRIDGCDFSMAGQQILLIAKGQIYHFDEGSKIEGYELLFGDCFWERTPSSAANCKAVLFNNASANQQIYINERDLALLRPLFENFYQEFVSKEYVNKLDVLAAYLKIIMIKIANTNAALLDAFDTVDKQLFRNFLELVSTHFRLKHDVAGYAKQLHVTTRRLTDLCNRCGGRGAKAIIDGQIIAESKRLLQFSSQSIKEIAYNLNFTSPDQFSHFFKRNTQMSPNDYRVCFLSLGA